MNESTEEWDNQLIELEKLINQIKDYFGKTPTSPDIQRSINLYEEAIKNYKNNTASKLETANSIIFYACNYSASF